MSVSDLPSGSKKYVILQAVLYTTPFAMLLHSTHARACLASSDKVCRGSVVIMYCLQLCMPCQALTMCEYCSVLAVFTPLPRPEAWGGEHILHRMRL